MTEENNVVPAAPAQPEAVVSSAPVQPAASAPHGAENTVVLRIPKPNTQVIVLGLVAAITLFQTVQLVRLGATAGSAPAPAKAVVAPSTSSPGTSTAPSGGAADVPQSMVGGC